MDNFSYGIAGASYLLGDFMYTIIQFKLLWGFVIGFGVAMLVQAFIATSVLRSKAVTMTPIESSFPTTAIVVRPRATFISWLYIVARTSFSLAMILFLVFAIISTVRV